MAKKKKDQHQIDTDYLGKVYHLDRFRKMLAEATRKIRAYGKKTPFEALAFTGTSGAAIAYPLSLRLNKPLICVRKKNSSHYAKTVEGATEAKTYIIVDDCVCSGETVRKIVERIKWGKCVGIYLYDDGNRRNRIKIPRSWNDTPQKPKQTIRRIR